MPGRVNVKFVAILSLVLLVVTGLAVAGAAVVLLKSGDDHARIAQQAEAAGDWEAAERSWSKAVNEERTNVAWLESYLNAIQKNEVSTPSDYRAKYDSYRSVVRAIAEAKRTDEASHDRFFSELLQLVSAGGPNKEAYQTVIDEVARVESLLYSEGDSDLVKSIRRYRGFASAAIAQFSTDISDDFIEKAITDLEQARTVRPSDPEIAESLYVLHSKKADRAKLARRQTLESEAHAAAYAVVDTYAKANPGSLAGQALFLRADIDKAVREVDAMGFFGAEQSRARRRTLDTFADRASRLADLATSATAGQFTSRVMNLITSVLAQVDPVSAESKLETIWAHASALAPEDTQLQFGYGTFLRQTGKHPEAIAVFERIADLPDVPVSTTGLLRFDDRNRAVYFMTDAAIERWTQMAGQSEGRAQWLEQANASRDRLAKDVPADRPIMVFLEARLAYAAGNLARADRLFRDFNTATNRSNPEGLKLAAEVANKLGNQGLEKDLLEATIALQPSDIDALARLASVNVRLRDYPRALQLLTSAHELRPDIEAINDMITSVRPLVDSSAETDPVKRVLIEAQLAQDRGEIDSAIEILRKGVEDHPTDVRIIGGLAGMYYQAQRWDELRQTVDLGLSISPEDRNLNALKALSDISGDIGKQIEVVEQNTEIPDLERQIALHRLHLTNEDPESAAAALAAARAIDPENRMVIIYSFDEALRNRNVDEAARIYEANKDRDIDGAEGLAMRARVELARGDKESARRTLQSAVERGSANPLTIKLLADVQMEMGQTFQALENYKKAIAIKPDIELIKGYIANLAQLGRNAEALAVARSSQGIGQSDEQFREMWLNLEGMVGDKQLAYDRRIALAQSSPADARNNAMLIGLALDLRKFDEARTRLDVARAQKDSLQLAALDARWHADRNDLRAASDVFSAFIASPANDLNDPAAYIAFGEFLIDRGMIDNGLTTLRQARLVQDKKNPIADAVLADRLFDLRRHEEAVPVLQALVDADFQSNIARSRLAESYLRLNKPAEAQKVIESFTAEEQQSLSMTLMRADVAALQGRADESNRLVDQAIQTYPDDPLGYMKRATRLLSSRDTLQDAIADLTRAIELNPANADAYRFRSLAYNELGRTDDAARDIVASAEANPDYLPLRLSAISRLIEMNREQMAADLADTALKRRPTDLTLMMNAGDAFTAAGKHPTALRFYERAWEQSKTFAVGQRLASSLVDQPRPDLRRARQIASDPSLNTDSSASTFMLRAKIEKASDNTEGVRSNLGLAYNLVKDNPQQLVGWVRSLPDLLGSTPNALAYLDALDKERSLSPWAAMFQGQLMLTEEDSESAGIRRLTGVIDTVQDQAVKHAALKVRSMAFYGEGDYAGAVDDMRKGLELSPNDAEIHNNLAYTLAKQLKQPAEALPFAERAVALDPGSRAARDTLGLVLLELNRAPEAVAALEQALSMAQTDVDKAPVLLHLARARAASGNTEGAREALSEAEAIITNQAGAISDETRAELEQVRTQLRNQ